MTNFPEPLRHLTTAKHVKFTDSQVTILLHHLGDLDPLIRDQTVFSLFARGFDEDAFTVAQRNQIKTFLLTKRPLFCQINLPTNSAIFLRSFSALLLTLVLDSDGHSSWLTPEERSRFFEAALTYLPQEQDTRGWVVNYGWAHGVAHGCDLLGTAWQHPKFPLAQTPAALAAIQVVLQRATTPFLTDEEPRIAMALVRGVISNHLTTHQLTNWLQTVDTDLWHNFSFSSRRSQARIHNWMSVIQHLYFLLPQQSHIRQTITRLTRKYYQINGYI